MAGRGVRAEAKAAQVSRDFESALFVAFRFEVVARTGGRPALPPGHASVTGVTRADNEDGGDEWRDGVPEEE